jgi:AcrR family transcriptional regulator
MKKAKAKPAGAREVDDAPTERGRRTRRALLDGALDLMHSGRSYNSLSLREVTHAAHVSPAAFYRHFRDMNELCLALVDDCGRTLRPLLREARVAGASSTDIIRGSMLIYRRFVQENPRYFLVASGERHGGSPIMRAAIRHEITRFIDEMAQDVQDLRLLPHMTPTLIRNVCELGVNTMLSAASDILDVARTDTRALNEMYEDYIWQMRLIFLGAAKWRPRDKKRKAR